MAGAASTTYRFASGRENEAPLLQPEDVARSKPTYLLLESPGKIRSRSAYINRRRPIFTLTGNQGVGGGRSNKVVYFISWIIEFENLENYSNVYTLSLNKCLLFIYHVMYYLLLLNHGNEITKLCILYILNYQTWKFGKLFKCIYTFLE